MSKPSLEETLARLRVLLWVAQADGAIQPWEKTILGQQLQAMQGLEGDTDEQTAQETLDRLLNEPFSITQVLSSLESLEVQQATYEEAVAIAHLDGITPAEEHRLAQIRHAFQRRLTSTDGKFTDGKNLAVTPFASSQQSDGQEDAAIHWDDPTVSGRGIVLGMRRLINHSRQVRSLILDYAIGAAILGLIPFQRLLVVKLLCVAVLILKMARDIGSHWGFPKGADGFALIGSLLGLIGALAIAFMAWLSVFGLGIVYPLARVFSIAAAFSTLTWTVGQGINHYYMSCSRLDVVALRRVLHRQAQPRSRQGWLRWFARHSRQ